MPKRKRKVASAAAEHRTDSGTMPVRPWVRWLAVLLILILATSVLAGAISGAPAQAAESSSAPVAVESSSAPSLQEIEPAAEISCLLDNDGDGVPNPDDQDIDGDGVVNGQDEDIDGDNIGNFKDGDPAATNCNDDALPPVMATTGVAGLVRDDGFLVTVGIVFALAVVVVITLLARRQKKEKH